MKKATYYHVGSAVCKSAQEQIVAGLDPKQFEMEIVNLLEQKSRIEDAEKAGVKSLPALVIDGMPFHINFGRSLSDLKQPQMTEEELEEWEATSYYE